MDNVWGTTAKRIFDRQVFIPGEHIAVREESMRYDIPAYHAIITCVEDDRLTVGSYTRHNQNNPFLLHTYSLEDFLTNKVGFWFPTEYKKKDGTDDSDPR